MNATLEIPATPLSVPPFVETDAAPAQAGQPAGLMETINTVLFYGILGAGVLIPVAGGIYAVINY